MKKIYNIKLPASIIPVVNISRKLPVNCHYRIKYGKVKFMQWSRGNMLSQRVQTYDFMMELFERNLQEDLQMEVELNKSCIVFYYGFSGNIVSMNMERGDSVVLPAGQHGAINSPSGKYQLTISNGWNAGFVYVFEMEYLDRILKTVPSNLTAGLHFKIGSAEYFKFPFFMIASIGQILHRLGSIDLVQKPLSIKMALLSLLEQYGYQLARYGNRPAGEAFEKVMDVKDFIEEQARNGPLPSISEISKNFNVHPDTLNRAFKNTFGISLKKYINQVKMKHAYLLLGQNNLSIRQAAERAGYNSTSSFSTQFKLYYGFPPGKAGRSNDA